MQFTRVFKRIVSKAKEPDIHTIIAYGGSSSSKTISILQYLTIYAMKHSRSRITVSSESMPVMRKTIFVDWMNVVMMEQFEYERFNKTEMVYRFPNNSIFQFVPGDEPNRWHGLRSDITYFDEVYYIKRSIWDQAEIRTKFLMFASFNPVSPFWIQELFNREGVYVDHSTYKDNDFLTDKIVNSLEERAKTDINFYNVYTLGQFGVLEGGVFVEGKHWVTRRTKEWPSEWKKHVYGLDFGYSVHPSALVEVGYAEGEIWVRQLFYATGMTNQDIGRRIRGIEENVIADSAEPKSIAELRNEGCNVLPAKKGRDSINNGIDIMKRFKINVEADSVDLVREFRNYKWDTNRLDEMVPKPVDAFNHAIDATRYAVMSVFGGRNEFTL